MKVVIDPAIEKNTQLRRDVDGANAYLEPQLGRFRNDVEAEWKAEAGGGRNVSVTLRFTDGLPGEATDTFPADILTRPSTARIWLRGVVDQLFGRRVEVHLGRVRHMLDQLELGEANGELEHAQAHVDGTRP